MGKNSNPVTGFKYSFGIHAGLCRGPIDSIREIRVGDKQAWQGKQETSGEIRIYKPDLFGGDKQEGGIEGTMQVMMGTPDQKAHPSLVAMLGHALPGFRRMVTTFFDGAVASNNPYPKPWKYLVVRILKGWENDACWYPEKATIGLFGPAYEITTGWITDPDPFEPDSWKPTKKETIIPEIPAMNPAHMILECMTNREWGRGLPISALDVAAFATAADTLADEKFGLCVRWARRDSLETFVQSIIDHISAVMYADRQTGLIALKLIRLDYDPNTLPIYDTDSGLLAIRESEVSALGPGVNEIIVSYTDPISGDTRMRNTQNLASLRASRGVFNSLKKSYPAIPTAELALRVAQRDLRVNAMALRRFSLTFDRRAWRIPPGAVFRIRDTARGIGNVVVRVGRVEDGTLKNGTITITAVQDVFGLPSTSFIGTEPPTWTRPDNVPALAEHRAFEVPYFLLNGSMAPADFAYIADDAGYLGTVVSKPTPLSMAYNLFIKDGPPEADEYPPTAPTP